MKGVLLVILLCLPVKLAALDICTALAERQVNLGDEAANCATSQLQSGATQSTCYWTHAYRSNDALAQFEQLQRAIELCLGSDSRLPADQQVNHPDSFELHQYVGQGIRVALSLKDKAGLDQSLVFLSISRLP